METNTAPGLVERAKAMIMAPKAEWPKIAGEETSVKDVLVSYALPLIAISPICALIGEQIFGIGGPFFSYHPSLMSSLTSAVVGFVLGIASLFLLSWIANFLSTKFGGKDDFAQAFRLCAYSATAAWVVGVFSLIPMLGFLGLLGLYSLYVFYLGATPMMGVPEDKAGGYTAVTVLCVIVVSLIVGAVSGLMAGGAMLAGNYPQADNGEVNMTIPGLGEMTSSDGTSTVEMPGIGKVEINEESGEMIIHSEVDGEQVKTTIKTED